MLAATRYDQWHACCVGPRQLATPAPPTNWVVLLPIAASGLSTGAIVGIACGAAAALILAGGVLLCVRKRRRSKRLAQGKLAVDGAPHPTSESVEAPVPSDTPPCLSAGDGPQLRAVGTDQALPVGPIGVADIAAVDGPGAPPTTAQAAAAAEAAAPLAAHLPELDTFVSGGSAAYPPLYSSPLATCPTRPPGGPPMSLASMLTEEEAAAVRGAATGAGGTHAPGSTAAAAAGAAALAGGATAGMAAAAASLPSSAATPSTPPASVADPHSLVSSSHARQGSCTALAGMLLHAARLRPAASARFKVSPFDITAGLPPLPAPWHPTRCSATFCSRG